MTLLQQALEALEEMFAIGDTLVGDVYGSEFVDKSKSATAALREAIAQGSVVQQWRPISEAPKDFVTMFDGWNGERVVDVSWAHPEYSPKGHYDWCVSEYENGNGWVNVGVRGLTHFMPLPPAPKEQS